MANGASIESDASNAANDQVRRGSLAARTPARRERRRGLAQFVHRAPAPASAASTAARSSAGANPAMKS